MELISLKCPHRDCTNVLVLELLEEDEFTEDVSLSNNPGNGHTSEASQASNDISFDGSKSIDELELETPKDECLICGEPMVKGLNACPTCGAMWRGV